MYPHVSTKRAGFGELSWTVYTAERFFRTVRLQMLDERRLGPEPPRALRAAVRLFRGYVLHVALVEERFHHPAHVTGFLRVLHNVPTQ